MFQTAVALRVQVMVTVADTEAPAPHCSFRLQRRHVARVHHRFPTISGRGRHVRLTLVHTSWRDPIAEQILSKMAP